MDGDVMDSFLLFITVMMTFVLSYWASASVLSNEYNRQCQENGRIESISDLLPEPKFVCITQRLWCEQNETGRADKP
jgi:hypothetical protein